MELYKQVDNTLHINVTGNSRIRILNNYEDGFINKQYLTYDDTKLKLIAYNPKNLSLKKKCYAYIEYDNQIPYVSCVWDYDEFTPSYAVYPLRDVKQDTLDEFKIKEQLCIDEYEMQKNQRIIDAECDDYEKEINLYSIKLIKKQKIIYPNIVSKYGKMIRLKRISNNYNELEDESDIEDEIDHNTIDISVFVEPQYN